MDDSTILSAENLSRVFGSGALQVRAVDDISFSLRRGEIVSIVGESGSGKSTLARLMLGLLPISSGKITFEGKDVGHMHGLHAHRAYWRKVQAIFQDPFASFNQFFSVQRVLHSALRLSEKPLTKQERSDMIRSALESVKLSPDDVLSKIPHELSGGQRQRVMIARAIMLKPHLLIADEPTTMIDASSRATVLNVLLDLHESYNPTIVFITHDISLAAYVSDRLFIMHNGKIVERGSVEHVMKSSSDEYTRQLFSDTFSMVR
ncbi:MAG TPA: dipeptide/oligopeptide/nickel ABC transporter ATP-binding protein [Spirochaetia bacterium]|nr:dipeptide/oligopeptide/nickel ABC transporter ATP-binding protein [Spirochaetia bacterium]